MLTFHQYILEADVFPQEKSGKVFDTPPKITFKEIYPGGYAAYHKNKKVVYRMTDMSFG